MNQLRKYGTQCTIYIPLIKASSQNFAVSGDYTHASGDVKISKDGGAAATATNSPTAITMGNGAIWSLTLSATEMQAAEIVVTFIDAATKAIEDQCIIIHTFGNASAMIVADLSAANLAANVTQFGGSNGTFASGIPAVNATQAAGTAWNSGAITENTFSVATGIRPVRANTCQSGSTSTTIKLDAAASAVDNFYQYQTITITGGTGAGQSAIINSYVGSTKVATVNKTWGTTPDATSTFSILREAELQTTGSVSLGTNAPAGWINAAAFGAGAIDAAAIAANAIGASELAADAASEIATAVRTELATELGRVDAAVSTRLASASYTAPSNSDITAIKAKTDQLAFTVANQVDANALSGGGGLDASGVRAAVGLASANLDTQLNALPTGSETATAVRSELATELALIDAAISSRGTGVALDAAGVRSAVGLASANLDTQIAALPTAADNAAELIGTEVDTGLTVEKALELVAALVAGKVSASSSLGVTTLTYKKRDGSTTSFTAVVTESDKTRATTGALS
jgi:hypothetical protein